MGVATALTIHAQIRTRGGGSGQPPHPHRHSHGFTVGFGGDIEARCANEAVRPTAPLPAHTTAAASSSATQSVAGSLLVSLCVGGVCRYRDAREGAGAHCPACTSTRAHHHQGGTQTQSQKRAYACRARLSAHHAANTSRSRQHGRKPRHVPTFQPPTRSLTRPLTHRNGHTSTLVQRGLVAATSDVVHENGVEVALRMCARCTCVRCAWRPCRRVRVRLAGGEREGTHAQQCCGICTSRYYIAVRYT